MRLRRRLDVRLKLRRSPPVRTKLETYSRARRLRREMTLPEVLLWRELRRRSIDGVRFRRQHPLGPYVLDFYCAEQRIAVEVDGWGHNMGPLGRDERRDAHLAAAGVRTLRFQAQMVLKDIDQVLDTIAAECGSR